MKPRLGPLVFTFIFVASAGPTFGCSQDGAQSSPEKHKQHKAHDKHSAKHVEISEEAKKRFDIRTGRAKKGSLKNRISVPAEIEHIPDRVSEVAPLVRGEIEKLKVEVGDKVEAGETLAVMRSVQLGRARAKVEKAKSSFEVAKTNFARVQRLKKKGIVSEERYLSRKRAFEKAKAELDGAKSELRAFNVSSGRGSKYHLESDLSGEVIEQNASIGEVKAPGEPLFVVADDSEVWVVGRAFERELGQIQKGQKALLSFDGYSNRQWKDEVAWVSRVVDRGTRNVKLRVVLDNKKGHLRAGMYGTIELRSTSTDSSNAVVPIDAVQKIGHRQFIFTPEANRKYKARRVVLGEESGGMVTITSGIEPGDEYVRKGAFDLKATMTAGSRAGGHHH
jgi:cobalt-zinc-cadmium efflux system membrane fusion protein